MHIPHAQRASYLLLGSLLATASCSGTMEPSGPVQIAPASSVFMRPFSGPASIPYTITNTTATRAYVVACGARVMTANDQSLSGQWRQFDGDACIAIYPMLPLPLDPGATISATTAIGAPGTFRLHVGTTALPGQPSTWTSTSAAFVVR